MNSPKPQPVKEEVKLDDKSYRLFANDFIIFGIVLILIGFFNWLDKKDIPKSSSAEQTVTVDNPEQTYWTKLGTMGDFTAGIGGSCFALGGFFYIFLSFKKQREANDTQLAIF